MDHYTQCVEYGFTSSTQTLEMAGFVDTKTTLYLEDTKIDDGCTYGALEGVICTTMTVIGGLSEISTYYYTTPPTHCPSPACAWGVDEIDVIDDSPAYYYTTPPTHCPSPACAWGDDVSL